MFNNLYGKLAAIGLIIAGILIAAFKLIAIGEAKQKAKTIEQQNKVQKEARKKINELHKKHSEDFKNEVNKIKSGDFSGFND